MTSIGPGLPFNAARAYGLTGPPGGAGPRSIPGRPSGDAGPAPTARPTATDPTFAPSATTAAGRIEPANAPNAALATRLERLVGGRVSGRVDFTGSAPTASRGDVLPLYTRAADKVEASVAVRLGSALDLRG